MSFKDILKKSFLAGYSTAELGTKEIIIALLITSLLAIYIFFCYRLLTRRTFYSKNFNISLALMSLITAAIILTIQTSVVVSLGMVGALSIVRFRTAIKDPMDLVFLFWSISVGIICGAGLAKIAIILSLLVTAFVFILSRVPVLKAPKILVISMNGNDAQTSISVEEAVKKNASYYEEKTRRMTDDRVNVIYELRVKDGVKLIDSIKAISGIESVSLLSHDGEVTF